MNIDIINIHVTKASGDNYIYIGRNPNAHFRHYGNPFTHLAGHTQATVKVANRAESVQCYDDWLRGKAWQDIHPDRREWILTRIDDIAVRGEDITLGCFCKPRGGFVDDHTCHGQVLAKLIAEARERIAAF